MVKYQLEVENAWLRKQLQEKEGQWETMESLSMEGIQWGMLEKSNALYCWMWSMIVQRSLFQPDVYPRKFVHPSRRGGVRGLGGSAPEAKNRCKIAL